MTHDPGNANEPEKGAAFTKTTPADLALRFGCGAAAGVAIVFGTWMAADVFGEGGITVLAIGVPLACGVLALLLGDAFFHQLARLLRWF